MPAPAAVPELSSVLTAGAAALPVPAAGGTADAVRADGAVQRVIKIRRDYNTLGGQRNDGKLRLALCVSAFSQMICMACRQQSVRRSFLPGSGGCRRHAAGQVRFYECLLGHFRDWADYFSGRPADQYLRSALRRGYGPADAWRRLWLHRLHADIADLCVLYLHLFCRGGSRYGLSAGPRAGHPAGRRLPGLARWS